MTKPEWSSAPGFVAAVRLTLDSSSLPRPSSLLQDSTVCPLEDDLLFFSLSRPRSPRFLLAFPAPTVQLRRYQSVALPS